MESCRLFLGDNFIIPPCICSISLCMESNAREKSTNKDVASRCHAWTLIIWRTVRICDVIDWFLQIAFWDDCRQPPEVEWDGWYHCVSYMIDIYNRDYRGRNNHRDDWRKSRGNKSYSHRLSSMNQENGGKRRGIGKDEKRIKKTIQPRWREWNSSKNEKII